MSADLFDGPTPCGCCACAAEIDATTGAVAALTAAADTANMPDPSDPTHGNVGGAGANGKPIWSAYQTAVHIVRGGGTWADDGDDPGDVTEVTFRFANAADAGGADYVFEEVNQAHTSDILASYADVAQITFTEASSDDDDANITFRYRDGSNGGGYWNGSDVVVSHVSWEPEMEVGTYNRRLMLHEIGHAMGLSHPGPYNGDGYNYADDADHWNDSRQYTNLSYWGEGETGASFGYMTTLGLHDILATQIEYGVNWETRSDDTVYGYNQTTGLDNYDLSFRGDMAFSIWDGDGVDTLDFSGSSVGTALDLRQGAFSSVNGQTYNISIAYGAVIENGTGSGQDDAIMGNEVGNVLIGGAGDDIITGGADDRPDDSPDPRRFTGVELNADANEYGQYLSLEDVSAFSGAGFTLEMMVDIIRMSSNDTMFASYASSSSTNAILFYGDSGGTIKIGIDNSEIDTGVLTETVIDGQPHRLSFSWDKASGDIVFYVDGAEVFSDSHQAGANIASGGTLVLGQEQDSIGGGFDVRQTFQGVMGDIRVFDQVRDAQDVADDAFGVVDPAADGLAHNWRADIGDTGTVTDVATANPPVDLTSLMPGSFTATQSSMYGSSSANRVLDDNNGTYNHTLNGGGEWLLVEFDQPLETTHVEIVNRSSNGARLNGAVVTVLDASGVVLYTSDPLSGMSSSEVLTLALPDGITASAVRIDHDANYLHVAEVNILGVAPDGVTVDPGLLNTDLTITGGATAIDARPPITIVSDDDVLHGGYGNDELNGGWGDDTLYGDADDLRAAESLTMARLNAAFDEATMGGGYKDHSLDQPESFAMPTTAVTFEMLVRLEETPGTFDTLFAYSNEGEWGEQHFTLRGYGDAWELYIGDQKFETSIPIDAFTGDQAKRLSISWDSASGGVAIYLDGILVDSGTVAQGETLFADGNLWLFSGWDDTINGSVGDIRVWDTARSAADISDDAWREVDSDASGLVANWRVNAADPTVLADAVGGANLTVQNVTANNAVTTETIDFGSLFNDTLSGGAGIDTLYGGIGDDALNAGAGGLNGWQEMYGEEGDDAYAYATSHGQVYVGGETADSGDADQIVLTGLNRADVTARAVMDAIGGGTALSLTWSVDGESGELRVSDLGEHIESFVFDDGTVTEFETTPIIEGDAGANTLNGTDAGEIIRGLDGRDKLYGGDGDDDLSAGANSVNNKMQIMNGGDGDDVYRYAKEDNRVYIELGAETADSGANDRVVFSDLNFDDISLSTFNYSAKPYGGDHMAVRMRWNDGVDKGELRIAELAEHIESFEFADGSVMTLDEMLTVEGGDGDDRINGTSLGDTLRGGGGRDRLYGRNGDDDLDAGASDGTNKWQLLLGQGGNDTYRYSKEGGRVYINHKAEGADTGDSDTIIFSDLNASDLSISTFDYGAKSYGGDHVALRLRWDDGVDSGELRIGEMGDHIETLEFADGTIMTVDDLLV